MSWPTVQLRRVARFAYGDALSDGLREDGQVLVYGSNGPVGTHAVPNTLGPALVIGRKGSFGKVQYTEDPVFAIDTTFYVDRSLTSSHLRWLYYALLSVNLDDLSEDVGVPGLSREKAYAQVLPWPPETVQRAISDYLDREASRIDALIAAKRRMVELLEERDTIAFETVALTHGSRFPSGLAPDWSQSAIPAGWKVMRLSIVLEELTNGFVGPTRDILFESGVPYIQSLHIKNGKIDFSRREFFVARAWHDERPRIHLRPGDVLIVQTGDIGQVAVVPKAFGEASCHALQIARVKLRVMSGAYLCSYLRSNFGFHSLLSRATGALHPHLEAGIKDIPVVVPPLEIQSKIVEQVERFNYGNVRLKSVVSDQLTLLQERRQALITCAVTGQLDASVAA